jgi:hypothetical protein
MKIKCRDASKIPSERLFCLDKKLYKIAIIVEGPKLPDMGGDKKGGDDDEGGDGHHRGEFDSVDDLDDLEDDQLGERMEKKSYEGGQNVGSVGGQTKYRVQQTRADQKMSKTEASSGVNLGDVQKGDMSNEGEGNNAEGDVDQGNDEKFAMQQRVYED